MKLIIATTVFKCLQQRESFCMVKYMKKVSCSGDVNAPAIAIVK